MLALHADHKGTSTNIEDWCGSVIDAVYTNAFTVKKKKKSPADGSGENTSEPAETFLRFPTRKTILYENILMQAPDGEVLCSIGHKKAKWYIDRDLAGALRILQ